MLARKEKKGGKVEGRSQWEKRKGRRQKSMGKAQKRRGKIMKGGEKEQGKEQGQERRERGGVISPTIVGGKGKNY